MKKEISIKNWMYLEHKNSRIKFWLRTAKGRDPGVNGRLILECIKGIKRKLDSAGSE
jgi:hypothetical protein